MKKYFFIALAAVSLVSCEEDTSINTPAFEAMNGYTFWRADRMQATVEDGSLIVVGANGTENITLYIGNYEYGREYPLGETNEHVATYSRVANDTTYFYSTSSSTGKGYIKLDPVEKQAPGRVSGTFFAEMEPVTGSPEIPGQAVVNFNKGVFFQIDLQDTAQPGDDDEPGDGEDPEQP